MRAKEIIITASLTVMCVLGAMFINKHQHEITYTETAVCKEKFPVFNQAGLSGYIVLFQYEDGRVEEQKMNAQEYTHYEVNKRYIFTRTKNVWR